MFYPRAQSHCKTFFLNKHTVKHLTYINWFLTSVALITSFSAFVNYLGFIFLIEITFMTNQNAFGSFHSSSFIFFFPFDFHILMNLCYLKFCSEEISDALRALLEWRHNLVIWPKLPRLSIQNFISI